MLGLAVIVAVLWQFITLGWPLSPDAGVFLWIADVVANGGSAYRDAAEAKFPFAWLPIRWMVAITGINEWAVRIVDLLFYLLGAFSLYFAGTRLSGRRTGAFAMLLYTVMQWGLWFGALGQPEAWVGALWAAGFALLLTNHQSRFVVAGIVTALAACVKPYFVVTAMVPLFFVLYERRWKMSLAGFSLGLLITTGIMVVYLLATDSLSALIEIVQWARQVYVEREHTVTTRTSEIIRQLASPPFSMLFPFAAAAPFLLFDQKQKAAALSVAAWMLSMLFVVAIQGKFWDYHWLPLFAPASLACSVMVTALWRRNGQFMKAGIAVAGVVLAATSLPGARNTLAFLRGQSATLDSYQRLLFTNFGDAPLGINSVVEDLKKIDLPAGGVLMIYGYHLGAYPLTGTRAPTRFANLRYVYDGEGTVVLQRYRRAFMSELEAAKPLYWIYPAARISNWRLEDFPEACHFLVTNYEFVANRGDFSVYRWRRGEDAPTIDPSACR